MNDSHHYLWILFAFVVVGVLTYIFVVNRPDVEKFASGSVKKETHDSPFSHGLFHIEIGKGSCTRLDSLKSMQPTKVK